METTGYPTCTKCQESAEYVNKDGVCTDCTYEQYISDGLHYYEGYYTAKCEALPNYDAMSKDERKEWVDAKVGYECERHGI